MGEVVTMIGAMDIELLFDKQGPIMQIQLEFANKMTDAVLDVAWRTLNRMRHQAVNLCGKCKFWRGGEQRCRFHGEDWLMVQISRGQSRKCALTPGTPMSTNNRVSRRL